MFNAIEKSGTGIGKSGTGIEKSGTGIEKSGTGIEKSGTGIEKSGTGRRRGGWAAMVMMVGGLLSTAAIAADPQVLVNATDQQLLVSVHTDDGILVGRAGQGEGAGYFRVPLYAAVGPRGSDAVFQPLVAGSGSGSSKDVAGSGSGSSKDVAGSGSGSSTDVAGSGSGSATEVAGSGSGSSGDACFSGGSVLVAGSGSGSSTDVAGSGSGSSTDVAGSGSGSSGDAATCSPALAAWGMAEIVMDRDGAHVVVHRIEAGRMEEYLLAYLPDSGSEVAHSLHRGSSNHGFIAVP